MHPGVEDLRARGAAVIAAKVDHQRILFDPPLLELSQQHAEIGIDVLDHSNESMPTAAALELATQDAQPPETAVLSQSGYENAGGRVFFRALWDHVHSGIPVERDYIQVLINARAPKAFSWSRHWHEPDGTPSER
jgi:hypothetical protein